MLNHLIDSLYGKQIIAGEKNARERLARELAANNVPFVILELDDFTEPKFRGVDEIGDWDHGPRISTDA